MKRRSISRSVLCTVSALIVVLVSAGFPAGAYAQYDSLYETFANRTSNIPSYYTHLNFNLTSPSTWATPAGGYANPGVYQMMPGGAAEFCWTSQNEDMIDGYRHWGLFLSGKYLGFGTVYTRVPNEAGTELISVTDYRLAFSGGNRAVSMGFAFGWSGKEGDRVGRTRVLQAGLVQRWTPYLSFGAMGIFSTEQRDQSGLFDLGLRPLGDERLSLFGDLELPRGVSLEDAPWSVGAMVEWPAGLRLIGRYFENESWDFGIAYSFGGAMNTGQLRLSGSPRFDKNNDVAYTNWGVRLGFPERAYIGEYFQRDRHYLTMNLKGPVVHTRFKYFDRSMTLTSILKSLEDAKDDPRVKGVALNLSGIRVSKGNAWEIRQKLSELQASGKHVVVYIDEADMTTYHLASVADRVVMDPEGVLLIPGYVLGRTYLANMLKKLGIGFDEFRFLKYKSAAEALSRTSMSEADREQRQALVDGYYETMQADVMKSRGVSAEKFNGWIDELTIVLPSMAVDEGLADQLGRWEDVRDVISDLEGGTKYYVGAGSLAGTYYPSQMWGEPPVIAVVYAIGECAMDSGIRARQLAKQIQGLRKNHWVKAVVLRVNSPGGSAMASDLVAEEVRKCAERKPVIVSQGDVAASGGYWISMYGSEIVAQPVTITGSIGVIGGWVWNDGIGEKLGFDSDFVKRGEHADVFFGPKFPFVPLSIPYRTLTESEREHVIRDMKTLYGEFVKKVAKGRGMEEEAVEKIAQGRVWTGVEGIENGLVNSIGGLDDAIQLAREKAGIGPDEEVQLLDYKIRGLFNPAELQPDIIPFRLGALWNAMRWWRGGAPETAENAGIGELDEFLDDYELTYLMQIVNNNGRALCLVPPDLLPQSARVGAAGQAGTPLE
jgi:protease-4